MSGKRRTEKGVKKGFSLMDWMRLTQHTKDLAGAYIYIFFSLNNRIVFN